MTAGVTRGHLDKIKDEVQYWPHQIEGIRTMARMGSFLLADEMGLGKSLQALTVAAIDFERGWAKRVLVVAPVSLKWNWEEEIKRFTSFTHILLDGTPVERNLQLAQYIGYNIDVLIVNYEQVEKHLDIINSVGFDIVIFDEAHMMKNPTAKRTKACLDIRAGRSFVITGSPLLNQVVELWAILHRIQPQVYPDFWKFKNRYAVMGGYKNKQIVAVKNKPELQSILDQLMIRRLKRDVLDLPDKQRITVPVDFHPIQRVMYQEIDDEERLTLPGQPDAMDLENPLSAALRKKQICGTTATLAPDIDHSFKLDRAVEMCQEITANGQHVVVFSQFITVMNCMTERLKKVKVPVMLMNGQTVPKEKRVEFVQQWGNQSEPTVLVAGLQVSGVGLNMTYTNKAIFLDKLWVPKLNEQAEDRLHRIGQDSTQPVTIYHIIVRGSIEHRVETILKRKEKLFDSLVEESDWKRALYEALKEEEEAAA